MFGRADGRLRMLALLSAFALIAATLVLRLAYWQLGQADWLRRQAQTQQQPPTADQVQRGQIVDRSGNVLAATAYRDMLAAYPDMISDKDTARAIATRVAQILAFDDQQTASLVATFTADSPPPYTVIAHQLTDAESQLIRAGMADGTLSDGTAAVLDLQPEPVRFYPNNGGVPGTTLASQLLGFVTADGQGRYGVEEAGQAVLAGNTGATADAASPAALPQTGGTVQLTLDAGLQLRLEKELYAAMIADGAPRVSALVMNPYTGAILAYGSVPGYDENNYASVAQTDPELFADPLIGEVYEPGSVMKMFTSAAALEEGVVNMNTPVLDSRSLHIGPDTVHDGDLHGMGWIPFQDVIAYSRNVGMGRVAMMLGPTTADASEVLYKMWQRFGLGQPTGIELGGEVAGLVTDPAAQPWQTIDLVNHSFGQGMAITPLQLATAYCAMVNGGFLPHPHIYESIDGQTETVPAAHQVISSDLSQQLTQLMIHVVDAGPHYAVETKIDGYVVGGKTGTAQIWDTASGNWLPDTYNHTFVGFIGNPDPQVMILVRIHDTEPTVQKSWGKTLEMTSNELFRHVALDAIAALNIPPLPGYQGPTTGATPVPTSAPAGQGQTAQQGP
jgi:cell division protein FtsI/penicillin-binding protein 2